MYGLLSYTGTVGLEPRLAAYMLSPSLPFPSPLAFGTRMRTVLWTGTFAADDDGYTSDDDDLCTTSSPASSLQLHE